MQSNILEFFSVKFIERISFFCEYDKSPAVNRTTPLGKPVVPDVHKSYQKFFILISYIFQD